MKEYTQVKELRAERIPFRGTMGRSGSGGKAGAGGGAGVGGESTMVAPMSSGGTCSLC